MPVTTPVPPYAELMISYTVHGARCINRWFFQPTDPPADDQAIADDLRDQGVTKVLTPLRAFQSQNCGYFGLFSYYRGVSSLYGSSAGHGLTGDLAMDTLPAQNTCNITWGIDGTGGGPRIVRGKTFFSGFCESQLDEGLWSDDLLAAIQAIGDNMRGVWTLNGDPWNLSIWRPRYNVWGAIVSCGVSAEPKVLRHRRRGL